MSQDFQKLLQTPDMLRDEVWEAKFLNQFKSQKLEILNEEPQQGPDSWPYLLVQTSDSETAEPLVKVIDWLVLNGIGMVVNPQKEGYPDYVFSYGMLYNYAISGDFFTPSEVVPTGQLHFEKGQTLHTGDASKEYFPDFARSLLKTFFAEQGIENMKILLVSKDGQQYDLCFSLEALGNPPEEEYHGILEALSWFFPTHYSLSLVSEKGLPKFFDL